MLQPLLLAAPARSHRCPRHPPPYGADAAAPAAPVQSRRRRCGRSRRHCGVTSYQFHPPQANPPSLSPPTSVEFCAGGKGCAVAADAQLSSRAQDCRRPRATRRVTLPGQRHFLSRGQVACGPDLPPCRSDAGRAAAPGCVAGREWSPPGGGHTMDDGWTAAGRRRRVGGSRPSVEQAQSKTQPASRGDRDNPRGPASRGPGGVIHARRAAPRAAALGTGAMARAQGGGGPVTRGPGWKKAARRRPAAPCRTASGRRPAGSPMPLTRPPACY